MQVARAVMTTPRSPECSTAAWTRTGLGLSPGAWILLHFLPSLTLPPGGPGLRPGGIAAWLDTAPINDPTASAGSSLCLLPTCPSTATAQVSWFFSYFC